MTQENRHYATGKRKTAIARTWLTPGTGKITVNKREFNEYFNIGSYQSLVLQPFELTETVKSYDTIVTVKGGGLSGQAWAVRHGITKALVQFQPELRTTLKKAGFITRDPRCKERKKYGQRSARARFQFSKR